MNSQQVMLATSLCFIYTLFTVFSGYRTWEHLHEENNDIMLTLNNCLWSLYYVSYIVSIIVLGSAATRKVCYLRGEINSKLIVVINNR